MKVKRGGEENNLLKHAVLHKITDLNKRYLHGGRTTMFYLNLSGHDLILKKRFGISIEKHCLTAMLYRLFQGKLQN